MITITLIWKQNSLLKKNENGFGYVWGGGETFWLHRAYGKHWWWLRPHRVNFHYLKEWQKKKKLSMFIHSKWFSWRTLTCNHLQDCVLCFLDCQRLVVTTQRSWLWTRLLLFCLISYSKLEREVRAESGPMGSIYTFFKCMFFMLWASQDAMMATSAVFERR